MADTATSRGRLRKQTLASNVNIWGDPYLNTNFDLLDQQIDGVTTIALGTSTGTTLTSTNYATDQQRAKVWVFTGTGTQTCTVTVPQVEQAKLVVNQSSGPVVIAPAAGTAVTVAAGERAWVYNDGTNFGRGDPTLDKVRAPTAAVSFNGQRITNLAAGTASSDAMRVGEAQTFVDTASAWANTTGTTVTGTLYSAQAWAIGGSGVPPGGAAKLWAQQFGTDVDGTGYSAKEWAAGTRTTVDGTYKSARAYVSDAAAQAGTASAWAGTASGWSSTASGWSSTASGWSGTASGWAGTASGWAGTASGWAGTAAAWSTSTALVDGTYKGARGYAADAAASAAGLSLPAITTANAGQVPTVKEDGSGYQIGPARLCEGGTAGGTANALTCTAAPAATLARGAAISLVTGASANTGAATLNANSLGAVTIQKNGSALVGGDLPASTRVLLVYDGTYWQLFAGSVGASGALWCGVATGTANALTLTPSTALSAYSNGVSISFVTGASDNSGAVTVAVSGLSAVSLYSVSGFALNARDLKANTLYQATYYSGAFRLLGTPAAGSITTTGLVSRIDAGDSACYSTGQTLTNLVSVPADGAASSSYSWVRGASTSAGSDDPTFNGSSGGMSASEYFSTDGGDLLSLAAGSNTTWLDGLHKAGATGTIAAWIYPTGTFVIFGTCDQSNRPGVFFRVTPSGPETNFAVFGDSGLAAASPSSTTTSTNAWAFVAVSFAEGVTNGSFYYINGNYAQVSSSNTFTLSYSSPSVNAANRKAAWFDYGSNAGGNTASGSRHAQGFLYNRALSKAELDAIFAATRARYGV